MSGLWFGSYFRGCLGALGGSASHGKRRGGGWAFLLYSVEGCFVLYLVSHSSPSISQVVSFVFHCVDFACTALARGIWGWVIPGPSLGKTEKLSFWFLPSLHGAKTLPRREEGVVRSQTFGEKAAPRLLGGCHSVYVLPPGQGRKPYRELWRSSRGPHPGYRGPQLGPLGQTGADTTSHSCGLLAMPRLPKKKEDPCAWSQSGLPEGQCPSEERSKRDPQVFCQLWVGFRC